MAEVPMQFKATFVWDDLKRGIESANKGIEKLGSGIKQFGRDQREQARNARLFASELNGIVPASDAAGQSVLQLGAAITTMSLTKVGALFAAFDVAKIAIQYFTAESEKAAAAALKLKNEIGSLAKATDDYFSGRGFAQLSRNAGSEMGAAAKAVAERQAALVELQNKQRKELANGENNFATLTAVGQAEEALRLAEADLAATRNKSDTLKEIEEINARALANAERRAEAERKVGSEAAKRRDEEIKAMAAEFAARRAYEAATTPTVQPFQGNANPAPNPFSDTATGFQVPFTGDTPAVLPDFSKEWEEQAKKFDEARAKTFEAARVDASATGSIIGAALAQSFAQGSEGAIGFGKVVLDQVLQAVQARAVEAAATSASSVPFPLNVGLAAASFAFVRGLISQIPARAMGGPVYSGQPYLVGERGPELFTPGASGAITPNHKMGGVTLNLTAVDGRSVERLLNDPDSGLSRAVRKMNRGPRV